VALVLKVLGPETFSSLDEKRSSVAFTRTKDNSIFASYGGSIVRTKDGDFMRSRQEEKRCRQLQGNQSLPCPGRKQMGKDWEEIIETAKKSKLCTKGKMAFHRIGIRGAHERTQK